MQSKAIFSKSIVTIEKEIKETIETAFQPSLAIVFASLKFDLTKLTQLFSSQNIQLIGATTAGEIGNTTIQSGGVSVLLLDIDQKHFEIIQKEGDYSNSFEIGEEIAQLAINKFTNPAFITLFSLTISGESLIDGISKKINGVPPIFGGMAGDDMKMVNTYTFNHNKIGENLATVLVLNNDEIAVEGMALCGWEPIGIENQITKAKDNIIYQINNEPALNVVKRYFGDYFANTLEEESVPLGAAQYPLQIMRKGNYVLRAALDANETDGSLRMAGPVEEGDMFRFSVAPGFEVIDDTIKGFKEYHETHSEADALLMFSCVARHMSLGPLIEDEIEGIYQVWKKPMAGFFSYGEVGQHGTNTSYFYNETCSLVLLRERN